MSNDTSRHLEIQPAEALIDAPVSIGLSGFPAGQQVRLHAQMPNYLGCAWTSHAAFATDAQGCVNVACKDLSFGPNSTAPAKRLLSANTCSLRLRSTVFVFSVI